MSDRSDYYELKGIVSDMTPEQQADVEKAKDQALAIASQSDVAVIGITLALMQLAVKA
ncbi:hypothetical protein PS934_05048 [Pseudomonas fluorescens]|uniref:hypothetical protein n=1 Tax=Pseudomonas fluorescens TaxID=294 RepID=UPI001256E6F9|nr:hypothetical protein [Pseudomonas fluorescens]VVQ20805.1 hypothetical protein PS934_05048 [Pseudomonas fluorescens]